MTDKEEYYQPHPVKFQFSNPIPFFPFPLQGEGEDNYDMNLSSYHGAPPLLDTLLD